MKGAGRSSPKFHLSSPRAWTGCRSNELCQCPTHGKPSVQRIELLLQNGQKTFSQYRNLLLFDLFLSDFVLTLILADEPCRNHENMAARNLSKNLLMNLLRSLLVPSATYLRTTETAIPGGNPGGTSFAVVGGVVIC